MFDTEKRRDKLRKRIKKEGIDALLVTDYTNVTYLTGFTGDDSYLLLSAKDAIILSDPRYTQQLEEECAGLSLEIRAPGTKMFDSVARVVQRAKVGRLGVEASSMTLDLYEQLRSKLPDVELGSTRGLVEELREIKDKEEIAATRGAIRIAERAFGVVRAALRDSQTEKEVCDAIEQQVRLFGGKTCSFPPIVAVGPRAALPHAAPTQRRIGEDGFVLIDWGARERLYVSDLTRMVVTAKIPPKLERIYGVVLKAQLAAIHLIRAGAVMHEVDAAARTVIAEAGFGKQFGHGLGHGIGLQIHESPRLAVNQNRPLKAGMIVTVEPGIYVPGFGGVRIEDDVLITKSGCEVLSHVPKEFADCLLGPPQNGKISAAN